jgi:hypothetical protein
MTKWQRVANVVGFGLAYVILWPITLVLSPFVWAIDRVREWWWNL